MRFGYGCLAVMLRREGCISRLTTFHYRVHSDLPRKAGQHSTGVDGVSKNAKHGAIAQVDDVGCIDRAQELARLRLTRTEVKGLSLIACRSTRPSKK